MSHLNPVIRPDKNGKMVTRHVKAMSQDYEFIAGVLSNEAQALSEGTL